MSENTQFRDDAEVTAGIEGITGSEQVRLYAEDGQGIIFPDMKTLALFIGGATGLVNGWKADNDLDGLQGIAKQTADAVIAEFKRQIALTGSDAAKMFPEDTLFGAQWFIDVRKAKDPNYVQVTIEQHIKALIVAIANVFAVARESAIS